MIWKSITSNVPLTANNSLSLCDGAGVDKVWDRQTKWRGRAFIQRKLGADWGGMNLDTFVNSLTKGYAKNLFWTWGYIFCLRSVCPLLPNQVYISILRYPWVLFLSGSLLYNKSCIPFALIITKPTSCRLPYYTLACKVILDEQL